MQDNAPQPKNASAEDVRALLARLRSDPPVTPPQVLDVRQDWEYEEFHLPGAKLVPLADIEQRLEEIPRDRPLVVYCHSGRRSAAAASLLAGSGFTDVTNMLGGIMAWKGPSAVGSPETGMQFLDGSESPQEILALAYAMERELGVFYQGLADSSGDPELKELFTTLVGFEDKHRLVVFHLYKTLFPHAPGIEELAAKAVVKALEGGREAQDILADGKGLSSAFGALDMAMGIEAQALDLYTRFADKAATKDARDTLLELAGQERGHLRALASMMDRLDLKKE